MLAEQDATQVMSLKSGREKEQIKAGALPPVSNDALDRRLEQKSYTSLGAALRYVRGMILIKS